MAVVMGADVQMWDSGDHPGAWRPKRTRRARFRLRGKHKAMWKRAAEGMGSLPCGLIHQRMALDNGATLTFASPPSAETIRHVKAIVDVAKAGMDTAMRAMRLPPVRPLASVTFRDGYPVAHRYVDEVSDHVPIERTKGLTLSGKATLTVDGRDHAISGEISPPALGVIERFGELQDIEDQHRETKAIMRGVVRVMLDDETDPYPTQVDVEPTFLHTPSKHRGRRRVP